MLRKDMCNIKHVLSASCASAQAKSRVMSRVGPCPHVRRPHDDRGFAHELTEATPSQVCNVFVPIWNMSPPIVLYGTSLYCDYVLPP